MYEYACHEGNYGMANILRAQRLEEENAQEGHGRHPAVRGPPLGWTFAATIFSIRRSGTSQMTATPA